MPSEFFSSATLFPFTWDTTFHMKILAQSLSEPIRNSKDISQVMQSFTTYEGQR